MPSQVSDFASVDFSLLCLKDGNFPSSCWRLCIITWCMLTGCPVCAKCFIRVISLNSHSHPWGGGVLSQFHRWAHWSLIGWVTWPVKARNLGARIQSQADSLRSPSLARGLHNLCRMLGNKPDSDCEFQPFLTWLRENWLVQESI